MENETVRRVIAAITPAIRQALTETGGGTGDNPIPESTEERAAVLRAMRAYCGVEQAAVAQGADLSLRTIGYAEKGHGVSVRAWERCMTFFATKGLTWDGRAITVEG
ncbi:hypothetical protein [Sphingomonas paucimobilis]|uniref:hypothetical protein n=1 Tax=Sphingomonas paucimobilis TaxID=13689 RepID=UPI00203D7760|nr:hypothetical protein [Sphingomonas paucimobilis]MCM3679496.1 hypothetical protein [Sphingomonas paucimobilis]